MKKEVISKCPICNSDLKVTKLICHECNTEVTGDFDLPSFSYLTPSQMQFIGIFLKNQGNIKGVEKDLDISYPTVKKMLTEVVQALGYDVVVEKGPNRSEILDRLSKGEISADEAVELMKKL